MCTIDITFMLSKNLCCRSSTVRDRIMPRAALVTRDIRFLLGGNYFACCLWPLLCLWACVWSLRALLIWLKIRRGSISNWLKPQYIPNHMHHHICLLQSFMLEAWEWSPLFFYLISCNLICPFLGTLNGIRSGQTAYVGAAMTRMSACKDAAVCAGFMVRLPLLLLHQCTVLSSFSSAS